MRKGAVNIFNDAIKVYALVSDQTFEALVTAFYCSVFPVLLLFVDDQVQDPLFF